jgi:hypothetical protein
MVSTPNRMKRDVIDDLGSFSSFYKRDRLLKRAAFNHDFLGTFSGFMNPNRYKKKQKKPFYR